MRRAHTAHDAWALGSGLAPLQLKLPLTLVRRSLEGGQLAALLRLAERIRALPVVNFLAAPRRETGKR